MKGYCLKSNDGLHCPVVGMHEFDKLANTFNHKVRGELIVEVDIDDSFKCNGGHKVCKDCIFNPSK